jgi:hypothetical protein
MTAQTREGKKMTLGLRWAFSSRAENESCAVDVALLAAAVGSAANV